MAFDPKQFRSLIERVIEEVGMRSPAAVNLLLGTAAQESRFGTYLRQLDGGPAVGPFQCEPATFQDLQERFQNVQRWMIGRSAEEMEWDIRLAILVCRLKYRSIPAALPAHDDLPGLAGYWKRYYNTAKGKGTIEEFMRNYRRYVV